MKTKGLILLIIFVFFISGCAIIFQRGRRSDIEKIQNLESELDNLKNTKALLE